MFRFIESMRPPLTQLRTHHFPTRALLILCAFGLTWTLFWPRQSEPESYPSSPGSLSIRNHAESNFSNLSELTLHKFADFPFLASKCLDNSSLRPLARYPPIRVVHFIAFLTNRTWATEEIVRRQWVDMALSGLMDQTDRLFVVVQTPHDAHIDWLKHLAFEELRLPKSKVIFFVLYENLWEFPGIHVLWEAACRDEQFDTSVYLYLHSKGATKLYRPYERWPDEMVPFYDVVMAWRQVMQIFRLNPDAQTIGFGLGRRGFQWYNIFWARGAHLAQLQEPIVTANRYYYERWLAHFVRPPRAHCDQVIKLTRRSPSFQFSFKRALLSEPFQNPFGHNPDDGGEPHSVGGFGVISCGNDAFDVPSIIAREKSRCRQLFRSEGIPPSDNICEIH